MAPSLANLAVRARDEGILFWRFNGLWHATRPASANRKQISDQNPVVTLAIALHYYEFSDFIVHTPEQNEEGQDSGLGEFIESKPAIQPTSGF